jgi:hypothetical protein
MTGVGLWAMGVWLRVDGVGVGVWMHIQPTGSAEDEEPGASGTRPYNISGLGFQAKLLTTQAHALKTQTLTTFWLWLSGTRPETLLS